MGIPASVPKEQFQVLFFQLYFNKKYVEVAISDFKMVLIILKWRRKQKFRQKRKTMRQKNSERRNCLRKCFDLFKYIADQESVCFSS